MIGVGGSNSGFAYKYARSDSFLENLSKIRSGRGSNVPMSVRNFREDHPSAYRNYPTMTSRFR